MINSIPAERTKVPTTPEQGHFDCCRTALRNCFSLTKPAESLIDYVFDAANAGFSVNYCGYDWLRTAWVDRQKIKEALEYRSLTDKQREGLLFMQASFDSLSRQNNRIYRSDLDHWKNQTKQNFADRFPYAGVVYS